MVIVILMFATSEPLIAGPNDERVEPQFETTMYRYVVVGDLSSLGLPTSLASALEIISSELGFRNVDFRSSDYVRPEERILIRGNFSRNSNEVATISVSAEARPLIEHAVGNQLEFFLISETTTQSPGLRYRSPSPQLSDFISTTERLTKSAAESLVQTGMVVPDLLAELLAKAATLKAMRPEGREVSPILGTIRAIEKAHSQEGFWEIVKSHSRFNSALFEIGGNINSLSQPTQKKLGSEMQRKTGEIVQGDSLEVLSYREAYLTLYKEALSRIHQFAFEGSRDLRTTLSLLLIQAKNNMVRAYYTLEEDVRRESVEVSIFGLRSFDEAKRIFDSEPGKEYLRWVFSSEMVSPIYRVWAGVLLDFYRERIERSLFLRLLSNESQKFEVRVPRSPVKGYTVQNQLAYHPDLSDIVAIKGGWIAATNNVALKFGAEPKTLIRQPKRPRFRALSCKSIFLY